MTERVKDWFGWEDFRAAIAALDVLREALAAEPEYEWSICFCPTEADELRSTYADPEEAGAWARKYGRVVERCVKAGKWEQAS